MLLPRSGVVSLELDLAGFERPQAGLEARVVGEKGAVLRGDARRRGGGGRGRFDLKEVEGDGVRSRERSFQVLHTVKRRFVARFRVGM